MVRDFDDRPNAPDFPYGIPENFQPNPGDELRQIRKEAMKYSSSSGGEEKKEEKMSQKRIKVVRRQATLDDVEAIYQLDQEVWTEFPGTKEMFASRIEIFPEGNVVALVDEKIAGYLCMELVELDLDHPRPFTWDEITDHGFLKKSHKLNGNYEYGVALTVSPKFQNCGIATRLFLSAWEIGVRANVIACLLGSRIPDYRQYMEKYSPEEYIYLRRDDDRLLDSELRLYEKDGFRAVMLLPNYINDPDSCHYGVLMRQKNPFHNRGPRFLRNFLASIISTYGHKFLGV
jgi:ribosomal protein S18 acetylase RimI-like enzyme